MKRTYNMVKKKPSYSVKPAVFSRKSSHDGSSSQSFQKAAGTWVLPMAHLQMQISLLERVLFFRPLFAIMEPCSLQSAVPACYAPHDSTKQGLSKAWIFAHCVKVSRKIIEEQS